VDLTPLRTSRNLRLLVTGEFLTGIGTQAALVALPYQVYTQTGSALLTGLLGAVELLPLIVAGLWSGALADRVDRRKLLLWVQIGLVVTASALAIGAASGEPPLWLIYVLGGMLAGFGTVESVTRNAIVPNLVAPEQLRGAVALVFGLHHLAMVIGPAAGGLLIAVAGVDVAYAVDALSCLAMVGTVLAMSPQPPRGARQGVRVRESIAEGLRFVRGQPALKGSFAADLLAMTFGMPRVLFPVLALTLYDAGAAGTGVLYSAVSVGATVAALTTGWLGHVRRLGRIVLCAIAVWGLAIAAAGTVSSLWPAAALLAVAGAADSVSAVCRATIYQTVTPDALRGRMSSVHMMVVQSGPRFGDVEAGLVASLTSARFAVLSGGLACVAGVGLLAVALPALLKYDQEAAAANARVPECTT
jgi:MFS family permease